MHRVLGSDRRSPSWPDRLSRVEERAAVQERPDGAPLRLRMESRRPTQPRLRMLQAEADAGAALLPRRQ